MKNRLILNSKQIREEKIPKETFGYSIQFVNKFLDNIADDYDLVEENYQELQDIIKNKENKIEELENIINDISSEKNILEEELNKLKSGGATDYPTVIKRISANEERVFQVEKQLMEKLNTITNLILKK